MVAVLNEAFPLPAVPPRAAAPAESAATPAIPAPAAKNSLRVIPFLLLMAALPS